MTKNKYEKFNSIAVLIVALSAVAVAVWQAQLTRKHNQLTVKPYLDVDFTVEGGVTLVLKNKGEGAAIVQEFTLVANGQEFSNWEDLFRSVDEDVNIGMNRLFGFEDIIGSKEEVILCQFPDNTPKRVNIIITLKYESIYGEEDTFETSFSYGGE